MTALLISYFGFVLMMLWMIMVCLMYPEPREIAKVAGVTGQRIRQIRAELARRKAAETEVRMVRPGVWR